MYGVIIALIPALLVSLFYFGVGSAIVLATSVIACVFFEWAIAKFILKREKLTICDGSAILTGLLLGYHHHRCAVRHRCGQDDFRRSGL